jgi:electron transport complex protein RnfD
VSPTKRIKLPKNHQALSSSQLMFQVLLACLPGILALTVFFGWGTLLNILWLSLWALAFEALMLSLRGRQPVFYLQDYSALVTAVLLGICLPPTAPWWLGIVSIFFAIVIAKHLYGGLGQNLFNPAMVGYVVVLIAFPVEMSSWILPRGETSPPGFLASVSALFGNEASGIDAYTGATAMDLFRNERGGMTVSEFWSLNIDGGFIATLGWDWVNLGFLLGGLWLLYKRIITWQIPLGMLGSLILLSVLFYDNGSSFSSGSPLMHLFSAGTMLGAFFIATDPVTAAGTARGRLIYGALIGSVTFIIRAWGAYPDGIAFAVLLGNFATPLIDYYTRSPGTQGES